MKTIAIFCKICGTRLTQPLLHLDNPREMNRRLDGYDLVPPGIFVSEGDVEQAWGMEESPERGLRNVINEELGLPKLDPGATVRINVKDTINSEPGGDRSGCCGPSGFGGLNLFCANCHTAFATEFADCHMTHSIEVAFADADIREGQADAPKDLSRCIAEWKKNIIRRARGGIGFGRNVRMQWGRSRR